MTWRFGAFELDPDAYELRAGGEVVPLEPQVFDVLRHLVTHRDRVVPKEELLDEVWGDRFVSESALTSRIKAARRAVGDDGKRQAVIRTVHGRGYRFVAQLAEPSEPAGAAQPALGAPGGGGDRRSSPAATRYTRSSGYDIAYQVIGDDGPDILFIPGFISNLDLHWEVPGMAAFFGRLAAMGRLILFDKRGTGVSERVPTDRLPTLEERMDDVRAVLDAVGSDRATLFGISEGGPMSLLYAATYPERVERLVLYGSFARTPFEQPDRMVAYTRRQWGLGRIVGGLAPTWRDDPAMVDLLGRFERQSASPEAAAALVTMASEIDASTTLSSIRAPTLVLHRRGDAIVPYDRGEALAAGIEAAELVGLDGRDHLLFVEPEDVLDHVERFIAGPAAAPAGERVLATMLLADVVAGSARDPSAVTRLRDRLRDQLARDAAGGGRVWDAGRADGGVLATFDGPARAVRCAQALVRSGGEGAPVRCAVHTSEVERVGERLGGVGLAVTAGALEVAAPGEVVVSRTVRDLVVGSGLAFEPRGTHVLPGVGDAWELWAAPA